jgi:photosystem II stability/assembly factor-like uncharacterized protein
LLKRLYRLFIAASIFITCSNVSSAQWIPTNGPYGGSINALAVSGTDLFAGGIQPGGLYRSGDDGANWTLSLPRSNIYSLYISGTTILAGTAGGIGRSTDYGNTWIWANNGYSPFGAVSFAVSGMYIFAASSGGLFVSSDDGVTWNAAGLSGVHAVAVFGSKVIAGTGANGVFLSTKNLGEWSEINNGLTDKNVQALAVSDTTIFAGTHDGGIFRSANGGVSWSAANTGLTSSNITSLVVSGTTLFAGTSNCGVFRSTDNGTTWTPASAGLTDSTINTFAVSGTNLFVGTQSRGVFRSTDNGTNWSQVNTCLLNRPAISVAASGTMLFAGVENYGIFCSADNGKSWSSSIAGRKLYSARMLKTSDSNILALSGDLYLSPDDGANWTPVSNSYYLAINAFTVSGANIYAGTYYQGVYRSTTNGTDWTRIDTNFTNHEISVLVDTGTDLFAGTSESGVYRSTDKGITWSQVNSGLAQLTITALAVSGPNVYAGTYDRGVFHSIDNGTTWSRISKGLTDSCIAVLAISGTDLFAGTKNGGVFQLPEKGTTWIDINAGLTNKAIHDLAVSSQDLVAGTDHGVFRRPLSELITPVVEPHTPIPSRYALEQNFPNPFNPSTTIAFDIPSRLFVSLKIFDVIGREAAVIVSEELPAGRHSRQWNAANLPSGVYFYRLQAGAFKDTKRLLLIK